ncbi:MAG: transposase [Desulfomonilia bacterium]|nr:transposase [Desulfomonilia bacterium]
MITFTVPAPFRTVFRQHQRFAYAAFFAATSGTMKKLASEQTWFPGDVPGFFGVLHTWGRQLQYHPHIHYIVPGGAFSSEDHSWHACRKAFYLPVRVAAKLVKHRMYTALKRNGLLSSIDAAAWSQDWNVNSQPVGSGERSIRYLASYVFRTAISDSRIVAIEDNHILFRYTDSATGSEKLLRLRAFEFIRRFLQHVLPSGFMKIHYYGFLHPSSSIPLALAILLLEARAGIPSRMRTKRKPPASSQSRRCSICNGAISYLFISPPGHARISPSGFT